MSELRTSRLTLRHFQLEVDKALYKSVFSDPDAMFFGGGIQSLEWTRDWIRICEQDYYRWKGYGPYAVVERETPQLIGYCGLFYFPNLNGYPELEITRITCILSRSSKYKRAIAATLLPNSFLRRATQYPEC